MDLINCRCVLKYGSGVYCHGLHMELNALGGVERTETVHNRRHCFGSLTFETGGLHQVKSCCAAVRVVALLHDKLKACAAAGMCLQTTLT
jgi:hypothetical protein